jgi:hypothetical protein
MVTMTEGNWEELKARIVLALDCADALAEYALEDRRVLNQVSADLCALIAEVDDANTRERYMALAAKDQLGLFDVEGAAI